MVLSPGAGRTGAAWVQPPAGHHSCKVSWQPTGTSPRRARGSPPFPVPPGFSPGDARGGAPCMKKTLVSPFPTGEGGRGDGGRNKAKGGVGRRGERQAPPAGAGTARSAGGKEGKPPCRVPQRQGQLATNRDKPPPGAWFAPFPSAAWVQPRGCKGRSPLHEKNLGLPLPHRGRGSGGWGEESKLKAGLAGEEKSKPPCGCRNGRGGRRGEKQAPLRVPERQGRQATRKASPRRAPQRQGQLATNRDKPPPGAWFAPFSSAARVQPRGCKGRSPLHEKNIGLPLPHRGRGLGGWGEESKLKAGLAGEEKSKPPLRFPQWQG